MLFAIAYAMIRITLRLLPALMMLMASYAARLLIATLHCL